MLKILLVSPERGNLSVFTEALARDPDVSLSWAGSGREALESARAERFSLAVIDSAIGDMKPLALVSQLLSVNAMINTAVMTGMDPEKFHEASEGLGIMASLPLCPDADDAGKTLAALKRLVA